ncbi:MAG: 50S ribosomal protein L23 [Myxococcales bacterium]|nr:50S ribosomal protein L23 [Myxococcales bacterium]
MSVKKDIHSILRRPVVTEKTTVQKEDTNQVVFVVRMDSNKIEIRRAVESLLGVKVTAVNTLIGRGKTKRLGRSTGKRSNWRLGRSTGKRSNWKKAIVTLAPGEEVEFFESLDELDEAEVGEE